MATSDDEDALAALRENHMEFRTSGKLYRRPPSPKMFPSSQPFGSSSPTPLGNPFSLEDDDENLEDTTLAAGDEHQTAPAVWPQEREHVVYDEAVEARASHGRMVNIRKRRRVKNRTFIEPEIDQVHASKTKHFGIPIHTLLSEVETGLAHEQAHKIGAHEPQSAERNVSSNTDMWVDKYRPKKFTELLGDERTNRDVMRWIRHWDYCVFGQPNKVKTDIKMQAGTVSSAEALYSDPHQRPQKRILMLTGPPGFGKTTLAHIAAKQAGYNVIEVNASDDRTGTVVQNKIGDALKSQAVFNPRPSLVVIDEVDGVSTAGGDTGFIKNLLKFITDDELTSAQQKTLQTGDTHSRRKSKKRRDAKALLRPIICICNDQYVSALRPLRQYCQIVNFRPLSTPAMVARLAKICRIEGMQADARALSALCEGAENDLRSCVNSLQYVRMKSAKFTLESVSSTLAKKDMSKSSHSVVEAVFSLPDSKKEQKKGRVPLTSNTDNISRIAELSMCNNEYAKILGGCFAQYPLAPYHDSLFSKPLAASDWLFLYDRCERGVYDQQHGELSSYMPYSVAAFHHLFATQHSSNLIVRSKADWEAREKLRINTELLASWVTGVKPSLRQTFTPLTFATEFISYGVRIIGPILNPSSTHLVKTADRLILAKVVDGMLSMGLHYNQYRVDDGSYVFRLEPPLTQLLDFHGVLDQKGENLLPSRYAVRQIISAELAAEKIRRSLSSHEGVEPTTSKSVNSKTDILSRKRKAADEHISQPAVKKDFFGRAIPLTREDTGASTSTSAAHIPEKPKATVHIRFSDGFSDAVRNNISIQELLRI